MLLFLYGSLLDPKVLAQQSGEPRLARRLRPAVLPGHARRPLRGTPYPTLIRQACAVTEGALLRPSPAALRRLAAYEGAEYRLTPVRLLTPRGPVRARAWIAPRWRAG
ncbi:gamma-glutamylcyclotransferase [Belnapia sp. T18]|uniref:Gamma-glutamylcyclotransferase n=1 Tax=Belnapia arida TaxID=2804533 RepID=A0ABS1U7V2_9PROT|nr:gamma-glutamylcyclotransferase family protein [Belnapia arida]MBL6080728.1 gamma-glutamylcyclotransferase [Belnapia arida]